MSVPIHNAHIVQCTSKAACESISSATSSVIVAANFFKVFHEATQSKNLVEKRRLYNEAFVLLKNSFSSELSPLLFPLLEAYARETCYAQESEEKNADGQSVDDELGFRQCARLMELSFCLQLQQLGLQSFSYDFLHYPSLEALTNDLQVGPDQKGLFFHQIEQLEMDNDVLISKSSAGKLREIMGKTLQYLTYSYQNITSLCHDKALHAKLQPWTEAVIGNETEAQKQWLTEYLYNRSLFMLRLNNPSCTVEDQVNCYEPIRKMLESFFAPTDPVRIKKNAQISNMQGCIIARHNEYPKAEPYFRQAYELYNSIPRDKFLIGNVLCGLIACLSKSELNPESAQRLSNYALELGEIIKEFEQEASLHCYVAEYPSSVTKAVTALETYFASVKTKK